MLTCLKHTSFCKLNKILISFSGPTKPEDLNLLVTDKGETCTFLGKMMSPMETQIESLHKLFKELHPYNQDSSAFHSFWQPLIFTKG